MNITCAGITPRVLIKTNDLQNTEKLSKGADGRFFKNHNGVCASMVVDWIEKCKENPAGVTDKSQLKSGLALSLMQSANMLTTYGSDRTRKGFMEAFGLTVNTSTSLKNTPQETGFFSFFKKSTPTPYEQVGVALGGMTGLAYISIRGNGGHALGYWQQRGSVQFFDPNEGVMQFISGNAFAKWFPTYIGTNYSTLMTDIEFFKIA